MNSELQNAVVESISQNRIVPVEYAGEIGDAIADLGDVVVGEIDYACENDGSYDVWGWDDETPENEHKWRLTVRCNPTK